MLRRLSLAALGLVLLGACGGNPAPVPAAEPGPRVALAGGGERLDARFACGEDTCAGWLHLPPGARPPVVVMAHGLAGTRDVALPFFADRFAAAGLAAFVFDYRGFGASGGAPRQLVDPWRQLEDWRAALAAVRGRQDLDAARLALFGSSLGGGHALIVAAGDAGVRAVVAQVPLVDSGVEGEATFYGVGWLLRLLCTAWGDLALSLLGAEPWRIPAIVPSGSFGMIADDAAARAAARLAEPGSTWRNEVLARSIFTFDEYNPAVQAADLEAPLLLVASRADRFAPFSAVEAFARAHPRAVVAEIDGDHFDVYLPPVRERAAALAAEFLAAQLAPAAD
jgi:pimeloyl-ACP methyl ester carboxylesterase